MSDPMKNKGITEFSFSWYDVLNAVDGIKQKKATVGALAEPWKCAWN